MLVYLKNAEIDLEELEKTIIEKQTRCDVLAESHSEEFERLKAELFKRELTSKAVNDRYGNDMMSEYMTKKSHQQSVDSKINSLEAFKDQVTAMKEYLVELDEDEKAFMKREVYDKLDAIREKIALRAITKFLMPYVNLKFKSRNQKQAANVSGKKKTVKKKK